MNDILAIGNVCELEVQTADVPRMPVGVIMPADKARSTP